MLIGISCSKKKGGGGDLDENRLQQRIGGDSNRKMEGATEGNMSKVRGQVGDGVIKSVAKREIFEGWRKVVDILVKEFSKGQMSDGDGKVVYGLVKFFPKY